MLQRDHNWFFDSEKINLDLALSEQIIPSIKSRAISDQSILELFPLGIAKSWVLF